MSLKEESENACFTVNIQKTKIMASVLIISCKIDAEKWKQWQTLFSWAPVSLWILTSGMKLKDAGSFKGKLCEIQTAYLKQKCQFVKKGTYSLTYDFSKQSCTNVRAGP